MADRGRGRSRGRQFPTLELKKSDPVIIDNEWRVRVWVVGRVGKSPLTNTTVVIGVDGRKAKKTVFLNSRGESEPLTVRITPVSKKSAIISAQTVLDSGEIIRDESIVDLAAAALTQSAGTGDDRKITWVVDENGDKCIRVSILDQSRKGIAGIRVLVTDYGRPAQLFGENRTNKDGVCYIKLRPFPESRRWYNVNTDGTAFPDESIGVPGERESPLPRLPMEAVPDDQFSRSLWRNLKLGAKLRREAQEQQQRKPEPKGE